MKNWSRGDKFALASLIVGFVACVAAVVVVPEVRRMLGLDPSVIPFVPTTVSQPATSAALAQPPIPTDASTTMPFPPTATPTFTPTPPTPTPVPPTDTPPPTNTLPSASPTIIYGFEDGTLQGWQSWDQREVLTIQNLTVTEAMSFSGQYALQVDVKGLSGSQGATIYLDQVTSLQKMFSAKLRLPPDAPADVEVWVQLAAASVGFEESPTPIYLSRDKWRTIVWNTSSYGWIEDSVRAIFIEMGAGAVEYTGAIYIDEIQIK